MEKIEVRKAEVTVHALRVGSRPMTKQMWRQVPQMNLTWFEQHPTDAVVIGWVADGAAVNSFELFITANDQPWRLFLPKNSEWYAVFNDLRFTTEDFPQLFIGA